MNTTATTSPTASDHALKNDESSLSPAARHLVFHSGILGNGVSIFLSLVVIVAIALPLLRDPQKRTAAASFNLYLVVLSLADLLKAVENVYRYGHVLYYIQSEGMEESLGGTLKHAEGSWDWPIVFFVNGVMFWMVGFICHEILGLLRNSKQRKRCKPPSLRKVMLQAIVAFAAGVFGAAMLHSASQVIWITGLFITNVPVFYSWWVAFKVFREGLMKVGANVGNRLQVLVVYFLRIMLVYNVVLYLMIIAMAYSLAVGGKNSVDLVEHICDVVWGFQGWVSFAAILNKPDVGKMVRDLFDGMLRCFRNQNDETNHEATAVATTVAIRKTEKERTQHNNNEGEVEHQPHLAEIEAENADEQNQETEDNREARLSVEFINGILDYLSDDEDDDNEDNNDKDVSNK